MKTKNISVNGEVKGVAGIANNLFLRARGMIGRKFDDFDVMHITPCSDIHMMFMSFPIDALFLNKEGKVVKIVENLRPWALYAGARRAHSVVEMPAGRVNRWKIKTGDAIMFE